MSQGSRSRATEVVHPHMARAYEFAQVPSAIVIDGWVYLTGVIAAPTADEGDNHEPAFMRAFEQIGQVLSEAGAGWGDVIKLTSFHLDIAQELPAMVKVKQQYMLQAPYPAWSVLGAASLANPAGICEIEVIARLA